MSKISVLTATWNAEATIRQLYESLRAQSFRDFEWVVFDGGSHDSTAAMLESFATQSPWLKVTSERDFGLYDALNKCIEACNGGYYVVAGADDTFFPDALQRYAEVAESSSADVILARVIRAGRVIGGFHPQRAWISHASAFRGSHSLGMLFKTALHRRFGLYSREFPVLADGYFLKLLLRSGEVAFHDAHFVVGEFAPGGASETKRMETLSEGWRIQMLTEPAAFLQTLIFLGKLAVRYPAVRRQVSRHPLKRRMAP
jgi:glycosyltransferase